MTSRTQLPLPRQQGTEIPGYVYDSSGIVIGTMGNYYEQNGTVGVIPNANLPLAIPPATIPTTKIDCGTFWYQDFGLEYTRINYASSWIGWYDWQWNFQRTRGYTGQGYYKDRHPSLGWYRGDDPTVLAWQSKWLVEHGCNWAVIQQRSIQPSDNGNWTDPENVAHWVYQLNTNVPEVQKGNLKLCYWLPHCASTAQAYGPHSGIWSASRAYNAGETVVTFNSAADPTFYFALANTTGETPASFPAVWEVIPTWSVATAYTVGDRIQYSVTGKFFYCIRNNTGVTPGNNSDWQVVSDWNSNTNLSWTVGQVVINTASDNLQYVCIQAHANSAGAKQPNSQPLYWQLVNMPSEWQTFVDFYSTYRNTIKTTSHLGKVYPLIFMWEAENCRVYWGTGTFRVWLQQLGAALNTANPSWDGSGVLMRNSPSPSMHEGAAGAGTINYDTALANRALLLRTDYPGTSASNGAVADAVTGYQSLIDNFTPSFSSTGAGQAVNRRVYCIPTSATSIDPHGSTFNWGGHTPAKFQAFVEKSIDHLAAGNSYPMVLIYNVSEWTEAGPALQPNKQDGFAYLTALKEALT